MDAEAYLKKQGWRGKGHSLDHTDRGIVRPLQVSKKVDALGVGIQKYAAVSDQWWLRAYDQGLKDLGTGKESALATAQKHGVNRGGLYARFVRGEHIPGTIGQRHEGLIGSDKDLSGEGLASTTGETNKRKKSSPKDNVISKRAKPEHVIVASTLIDSTQAGSINGFELKQQIQAYINEATQQGLIPIEIGSTKLSASGRAPSQKDMDAVLRLAKIHRRSKFSSTPALEERKKLIRKLKRAALAYHEAQMTGD